MENPITALSKETGRSKVTIYRIMSQLGRLPTKDEIMNWRKAGRPRKYNY